METIDEVQEILESEVNMLLLKLGLCGAYPGASPMQKRLSGALALRLDQTRIIASLLGIELESKDE